MSFLTARHDGAISYKADEARVSIHEGSRQSLSRARARARMTTGIKVIKLSLNDYYRYKTFSNFEDTPFRQETVVQTADILSARRCREMNAQYGRTQEECFPTNPKRRATVGKNSAATQIQLPPSRGRQSRFEDIFIFNTHVCTV